ncbi:MAG: DNA-binding protein [Prevotella sp.]|jgi:putative SAP DNA-binding domain-containing protein|nr:DNA-binding protein [uncultured Prevotella sp.]MBF1644510.1 DNA-binding protein [Prevotella sp.]
MKHDVLTAAMIERAKQKAKQKAFFERQKQEYEKNEQQERQRNIKRLQMEREFIHAAQQTIKGINDAIMGHFGKRKN